MPITDYPLPNPWPALSGLTVGATDLENNVTLKLNDLAAIIVAGPQGFLTSADKTLTPTILTSLTTLITLSFSVVSGRWYEVKGFGNGAQSVATSTSKFQITDDQSGSQLIAYNQALAATGVLLAVGSHIFQASSTRTASITLQAAASAGTFTVGTGHGAGWLAAIDLGT